MPPAYPCRMRSSIRRASSRCSIATARAASFSLTARCARATATIAFSRVATSGLARLLGERAVLVGHAVTRTVVERNAQHAEHAPGGLGPS